MSQYFNKISIYGRQRRHRHLISPTQHGCTHGTLWNVIFRSLTGYEIDVIDTQHFNNDADFLYRLATALRMRPNHEYWCKCTWRTNGINKTATSDSLDLHWQLGFQWHRRGIELVFRSLDCFTKWLFHSATIFLAATYVFCCLKLHQADYKIEKLFLIYCFFYLDLVGKHSAPMYLLFAPYTLGRRGCFGVSNVALVISSKDYPQILHRPLRHLQPWQWQNLIL